MKAATGLAWPRLSAFVAAEDARRALISGHARFLDGLPSEKDFAADRERTASGQQPIAAVVTCSDSRITPEYIFDQGVGKLFVVQSAGDVVDSVARGSLEFAVAGLGVPLVVVLGHSDCGAVMAAAGYGPKMGGADPADGSAGAPVELEGMQAVVEMIRPSIQTARGEGLEGAQLLARATVLHVAETVRVIGMNAVIAAKVEAGEVSITGAVYDVATGDVAWL